MSQYSKEGCRLTFSHYILSEGIDDYLFDKSFLDLC